MLHVRIITPPSDRDAVLGVLGREPGVCNVVVLPGAAVDPAGDLVSATWPGRTPAPSSGP
ncbi:MAG TPA: hypothetical protein VGB14_19425 [Acidimicrobiales bacterium]